MTNPIQAAIAFISNAEQRHGYMAGPLKAELMRLMAPTPRAIPPEQFYAAERREPHGLAAAHARIADLEAQLSAVGAGGVEPLPKQAVQAAVPTDADIDAAMQAFDWDGWIDQDKAKRASYFMRRFLKEEKLLGPKEQVALHYVISLLAATQPAAQGLEVKADMYWDAEDTERCETSINNVVVEVDSYRGLEVGDIVEIQRAARLPNIEVRITMVPDNEGNGDLEWEEVAAQAKQGGAANG